MYSFTLSLHLPGSLSEEGRNVLLQSLEKKVHNEYEPDAICYSIIVYLNEVCEYRLFLVFTAELVVKIATQAGPLRLNLD